MNRDVVGTQISSASIRSLSTLPANIALIVITRYWPRPHRKEDFTDWWPDIAPPVLLLKRFHRGDLDWEAFVAGYCDYLATLDRDAVLKRVLILLQQYKKVVFLCWEVGEEATIQCHRRLFVAWLCAVSRK